MPLKHDLKRGAACMLAATMFFAVMSSMVKLLSDRGIPFNELMFFRVSIALPVVWLVVLRAGDAGWLRTKRLGGHGLRACTGTLAMGTSFFALTLLPLAEHTALSYTQPLFVTLLAIPFLGERPGIHRWSAVLLGFGGIMVIAIGQGAFLGSMDRAMAIGMGFAVAQGFFSGLTTLLVRGLSATEKSTTIVMWQSILMTGIVGLSLPFAWVTPHGWDWPLILGIGLTGAFGQLLLTEAYASAQVSALGPYSYTSIIWASVLGLLIWGTLPTLGMVVGSGMIIAAGLYILHRELLRTRRK